MKKKMIKISLVLLTLMLLVATATMAVYAVDWDGTSTGSGGAGGVPGKGGFTIYHSEKLSDMLVGYRFSYATNASDQDGLIVFWNNTHHSGI